MREALHHRSLTLPSAAALCLLAAGALPLCAEPPEPPPYYAIRDARVVVAPGKTLERATVLLADGLIEAVGTDLEIPADAWIIDGEGLTVYPGFTDGLTTLGQKKEESESGPPGGGRGGPPGGGGPEIRGPQDRPATTPWVSAADLQGDDNRIEKWRAAGFTAAVTAPTEGLFAGQAALIDLGGAEPRQRVVAAPVAQRLNFRSDGGFRRYPGSLMGVLSYIGQVLSDARYYADAKAFYARSPLGHERPEYDRTLEPLEQALAAGTPFLLPADLGREVDRALTMRERWQVPAVLYGGQGAWAHIDRLASSGTPVLVSLDWPEAEKDRDPDADTPFRTLVQRRLALTVPQALYEAGVPFAFYSAELTGPSQIFENLRKALEAGLDPEAALAGLTTGPAGIFGVADRLGTVEKGKIANLVLASSDPWAEDVEVAAVFVDGRRYAERKSEEPSEPPAQDVSGTWTMALQTPGGSRELTLEVEMAEDGKVTGELNSDLGTTSLDEGRMSGDLLRFDTTREMGGQTVEASWSLTVEGESLSGTMTAGPMGMDVSGERTAMPEAESEMAEAGEEAPAVSADELREGLRRYQGPVQRLDAFAITNARVYPVTAEPIDNGTVLVRDGKIAAVGADVAIPDGVEVFDAAGGSLIPGIFDAHSHIAVDGGVNEGTLAVTAMVAVGDVLDPDDIAIYRALAGGVTTANILHGSANPIGGQNAVIKLRWGADADGLVFQAAPPGIKFALGENPKRSNFRGFGIPQRYPQTRMGVMDVIRQAFTQAREYQQEWQRYRSARATGRRVLPPRRDFELDALVEILEGKRLVHSHCYRADEILQLLRLAEDFGFRIATLQHVLEGYKVADEIAAHGAGGSTFSDWWGYKVEAYDAIPYNSALMTERGVVVSVNSDSDEEMRHLNQEAGKAMHWGGLDEGEALKLVTLNPAIQFGVADRIGSIEVGKDADLVLYDGPPLAISSIVQKTFVDGDLYFDRQADRERQTAIEELKARLEGKSDAEEAESGEDEAPMEESAEPPPERRRIRWQQDVTYTCREEG